MKTAQQQVKQQQYFLSISCDTHANLFRKHVKRATTAPTPAFVHLILRDTYPTIDWLMQSLQQLIKML